MSDSSVTKSKGLIFAEQQMQRHGWSEGKGLGKNENGISQAIKVKVKCDTAGVGHNSAEQFTFHWWDHVFNKTASSISIEADKDGVQVKKLAEDDCTVTNKKPRKGLYNPNMLYGRFIKSATLLSGGEKPVEQSSSESSDSSEDEDEKLDLSSATKLTDDDLIRVCGGRTAHKGARHGLTMSAKLSRLQEQEREFMEKYGKKEQKSKRLESNDEQSAVAEDCDTGKKHKKKKKQKHDLDTEETLFQEPPISKKKKKSKKEKVVEGEGIVVTECDEQMPDQEDMKSSKKKKKRKQRAPSPSPEEQVDHSVDSAENCVKAKKKKKKHCKAE